MSKRARLLVKALEKRVKDNQFFRDDAASKTRWCDAARFEAMAVGLQIAIGQVIHEFKIPLRKSTRAHSRSKTTGGSNGL